MRRVPGSRLGRDRRAAEGCRFRSGIHALVGKYVPMVRQGALKVEANW